jgi:hypothetical protein
MRARLTLAAIGMALSAMTGVASAGPNDIDFMGTRTEGGRVCDQGYCPAGAASFRAHGDILFVCDYRRDGLAPAVGWRYPRGGHRRSGIAVNYWGSRRFNGCRTRNLNFPENVSIDFKVCLARYARPGGRPIRVVHSTCGAISEAFNGS